jgi:hypothetical protein
MYRKASVIPTQRKSDFYQYMIAMEEVKASTTRIR